MTTRRDQFYRAYDDMDEAGLAEFLVEDAFRLTSEATQWLLDRWADEDRAAVAPPAPPPETNRRFIGGVDV